MRTFATLKMNEVGGYEGMQVYTFNNKPQEETIQVTVDSPNAVLKVTYTPQSHKGDYKGRKQLDFSVPFDSEEGQSWIALNKEGE